MQIAGSLRNAGGDLEQRRTRRLAYSDYGFLFRDMRGDPWQPNGSLRNPRDEILRISEQLYGQSGRNPEIPAGYTYFGQFVTHDLTHAVTPFAPARAGTRRGQNRRTPSFDLDSVYGGDPADHPYFYELNDTGRLLVGLTESGERDLPRNHDTSLDGGTTEHQNRRRTALIGDPRNDENAIVSQLHLAFLLFHNRLVDQGRTFDDARRLTRWCYQLVVLDLLRRLCGRQLVSEMLGRAGEPRLHFFKVGAARIYLPLEFSFAAFRAGHSMVNESYHLNDSLEQTRGGGPLVLFQDESSAWGERDKRAHNTLEGQRELPKRWTIQWDRFVGDPKSPGSQQASVFDRQLARPLRTLPMDTPIGARDERERSLAYRTLLSGWLLGLPSGQRVAAMMGQRPLPPEQGGEDPLWVYVLREAEEGGGLRLGPVGGRIVAEVCVGLLAADPESVYANGVGWEPWEDLGVEPSEEFELRDFLAFSGLPITRDEWEAQLPDQAPAA
jgi:hypothetical protein